MKLTCSRAALTATLDVAMRATLSRTTLPILTHVLFDATDDLTLTGTDLETRAWQTTVADVTTPGSVALPPHALATLLDQATADNVTISVNASWRTVITCGRAELKLPGLDPEGFPAAPSMADAVAEFTMPADALAAALGCVLHAVAHDESRPVLSGVLLEVAAEHLTLAAADGHRLALRRMQMDTGTTELSVIVHGKGLTKAARVLAKASDVRLTVDAKRSVLVLETAAGNHAVRLIDGQFPDFNRIIPRDPVYRLVMDRTALLGAIKLAEPVAKDNSGILRLTRESDGLVTFASATDHENAESVIAVDANDEGYPSVAYNVAYLRQAVEAFGGQTVTLAYSSATAPGAIFNGSREESQQILMPMHIARPK